MSDYAVGIFAQIPTRSALKKAIKKQYIIVDGNIGVTGTFIKGGEKICLRLPIADKTKKQLDLPLKVLYEDEYLAAVYKPAGLLVSGNKFKTLANALSQNLKTSTLANATKPQPVHRLDYATTGIVLVGKTNESIRLLNKLFEDKAIQKTYYAVTIGEMKQEGSIQLAIDGKAAQSNYKRI